MFFFFLKFLSCPFKYLRTLLIKNIVFSNCACFFKSPERCAHVTCFYFCFVLFGFVLFFNQDDDIQLQNKHKCPSPPRISYKCQFSGLVSSTQLFDLFTFSNLMEIVMKKWWRYNMSHKSPPPANLIQIIFDD